MPRASSRLSAGVLVWRRGASGPEFLLVHPGGPFWRHRDDGAWSIPKGLIDPREEPLAAARREFEEEVGIPIPGDGDFARLADRRQKSGKTVIGWLVEADLDLAQFRSNTFELAWPPRSGRVLTVPECDRAAYFATDVAARKIIAYQRGFIEEAVARLG